MHDWCEPIDPYAEKLIRFKSKQVCRQFGWPADFWTEIRDELSAHLSQQLKHFDSRRARRNTFIARVVERKLVDIVRYYTAHKRSREREEFSLNETVFDCDGRPVDRHQVTPEASDDSQRLHELERDIKGVLAGLSRDHQDIALGIVYGTINSVSHELGLSRSEVERHVAELSRIFEDAGLREYL